MELAKGRHLLVSPLDETLVVPLDETLVVPLDNVSVASLDDESVVSLDDLWELKLVVQSAMSERNWVVLSDENLVSLLGL